MTELIPPILQMVDEGKIALTPAVELSFLKMCIRDRDCPWRPGDVGRILRTFKIKKNVEVTDNGKIII